MRRIVFLLAAVLGALAPMAVAGAVEPGGWTEGFSLHIDPAVNCGIQGGGYRIADVEATKVFGDDGAVVSSSFTITLVTGGHVPAATVSSQFGPTEVPVPDDPDWLSVSSDLGWAGLDASVVLRDTVTGTDRPVEIHLSLFATAGVTVENGTYARPAAAASDALALLPEQPITTAFGVPAPVGKVIVVGDGASGGLSYLTACPLDVSIWSTRTPEPLYWAASTET